MKLTKTVDIANENYAKKLNEIVQQQPPAHVIFNRSIGKTSVLFAIVMWCWIRTSHARAFSFGCLLGTVAGYLFKYNFL
jgi:hypothetical protein